MKIADLDSWATPQVLILFGKIVSSIMLPLETASDAKTPSQHPKTRISTNCDDFFRKTSKNSSENEPKYGLEWSGGAETLPITTTIERNNWAKSEDDLSTLSRRTKDFQYLFSILFGQRRSPKKRCPSLQRAGSRSSGGIFARDFFYSTSSE